MPMRIEWLREALRNLDVEAAFIAKDNPDAVRHVVERVYEAVQSLERHPNIGRPGRVPGTRELVVAGTPYLVPYRVQGEAVEVLRVFHTARRTPKRW